MVETDDEAAFGNDAAGDPPHAPNEPLLRLRGIDKNFGPVQALVDVDLDVPAGQVTALIGDNGAGKTVLIKCIAGIWEPDGGQISWEGRPVHIRNPRDAAALGIATVYQDLALCDNLDIVQNMFLGREKLRGFLLSEDEMEQTAADTLARLSVTTVRSIRQPVASLSGGQRQAVAVAKALMWQSKLVIMDEPTAALGVAQTAMVLDLIKSLAGQGIAVIMISHNLNNVFQVADALAVLTLGRIVATAPASQFDRQLVVELMTTGRSARMPAPPVLSDAADEGRSTMASPGDPRPQTLAEGEPSTKAAATHAAALAVAPEIMADTFTEYLRAWLTRIRGGESGVLPVAIGLAAVCIIFQAQNSKFLSSGNLTNLLVQGAVFMLLGMAQVYALLLGEIDLSIGFVSGIGGVVTAELVVYPRHWPWWAAILVALAATAAIGALQGTLITRLRLPSFVVTLAGLLGWQGVMILMLGPGGTIPIPNEVINNLTAGDLSPVTSWVVMFVVVGLFGVVTAYRDTRRRSSGLVAPPVGLTVLKVGLAAAAGVSLVLICNSNRGGLVAVRGVPWVVLIVLGVLAAWSVVLGRTRFGRYVYAIGCNPEAARRAGVSLAGIRTAAFALAGLTAGIAGIVYASRLRSVSTSLDGGTLVLYSVASAVIGGTSLFGGRGKALHAVLGGIVIAAIYNGMGLLGMSAASQYMVTALVLLAAVTVDAVARRGRIQPGRV